MGDTGAHKHKKVANSLVALSSAAVLAVYSAGYQRTKVAAERFERLAASRRHAVPAPWNTGGVPATGTVAHGHAIEGATATPGDTGGVPATGTVAGPSSAVPAPPPVAPTAVSRAAGGIATEPAPVDRGRVIDGATATPWDTGGGVPATSGVARGRAIEGATATPWNTAGVPATSGVARGRAIEGATATPWNTAGVPATSTEPQPTANAAPTEIAPITPPPQGRFKDGTYQGRGSCIHGDIQAQVVVKNGRITEATISSCETRYSCDWLDPILPQVAARQSAFVDYVSGATDSTDAFSAAVTDALLKAQ